MHQSDFRVGGSYHAFARIEQKHRLDVAHRQRRLEQTVTLDSESPGWRHSGVFGRWRTDMVDSFDGSIIDWKSEKWQSTNMQGSELA